MNKFAVPALVVMLVSAVVFGVTMTSEDQQTQVATSSQETQPIEMEQEKPVVVDTSGTAYTSAQVAEHSTEQDCWTHINGSVYDITPYLPRHPGGDSILLACGGDGTSLFEQRQDENGDNVGSGTPHSDRATNQLADLRIGYLED